MTEKITLTKRIWRQGNKGYFIKFSKKEEKLLGIEKGDYVVIEIKDIIKTNDKSQKHKFKVRW